MSQTAGGARATILRSNTRREERSDRTPATGVAVERANSVKPNQLPSLTNQAAQSNPHCDLFGAERSAREELVESRRANLLD